MAIIVSLLVLFLPAEIGFADPPVYKAPIKMIASVVKIAQQTDSRRSQRRERVPRLSKPQGVTVDKTTDKLYWTDSDTHKIYSANLDGTELKIVVKWTPNPRRIAVDNGKIYWTDSGTHQIHRSNLTGSETETLVKWVYDPRGIAVDSANGKIYWTDSRTHQIYRANLDGSQLEVLIAGLDNDLRARLTAVYQ
jgi:DNA-binding beta-propeller fold protein YncE